MSEAGLRLAVRRAAARFATGVTILTARDASLSDWGVTVTAVLPVSHEPPLVAVALRREAGSTPAFLEAERFVLSVLAAEHEEIAERFASGRPDRFVLGGTARSPSGPMVVNGALATLECRRVEVLERGDHALLLGEVERASTREGTPLVRYVGEYVRPP